MPEINRKFDPYLHWLGIRDGARPPDHYRLLGIDVFESDPDVITSAADRQMAHVRTFQAGKQSLISQRILNELAAARLCLLQADRKQRYDRDLRAHQQAQRERGKLADANSTASMLEGIASSAIVTPPFKTRRNIRTRKATARLPRAPIALSVAAMLAVSILFILAMRRPNPLSSGKSRLTAAPESSPTRSLEQLPTTNDIHEVVVDQSTNVQTIVEPAAPLQAISVDDARANSLEETLRHANGEQPELRGERPISDEEESRPSQAEELSTSYVLPTLRPTEVVESRASMPDAAVLKSQLKEVRTVYHHDFEAARTADQQRNLARQLHATARANNIPESTYALLESALTLYVMAAEIDGAFEVISDLEQQFSLNGWKIKAETLAKMGRGKSPPREMLLTAAESEARSAAKLEQFDAALQFTKIAQNLAQHGKDRERIRSISALEKTIQQQKKYFDNAVAALNRLHKVRGDADASMQLGSYLCFVRDNWEQGLPLLAGGTPTPVADAAKSDLKLPSEPAELVAAGDHWWDAAESTPELKRTLQARARFWYEKALPHLAGLDAARAAKRVEAVQRDISTQVKEFVAIVRLPGNVKLTLRKILPGKYLMGSPLSEFERTSDEVEHQVVISKSFYIGTTEVTQAQWMAVMNRNPSEFTGDDLLPVDRVTWDLAQQFCGALNESAAGQNFHFRLPTEAEAEYAFRAGTKSAYFFGDSPQRLSEYAWSAANAEGKTHTVAQLKPNPWGLYDVYGNVAEWCQDNRAPYTASAVRDPIGPARGEQRVHRCGTFRHTAEFLRSASRSSNPGSESRSYLGLRIAAEANR